MNVIFLDIDGVMNSELFYRKRHKKRWLKLDTYIWFIQSKAKFVLNGFKYKPISLVGYEIPEKHKEFNHLFDRLIEETDNEKWKWLYEYCNKTNTKICISSTWKNHFHSDEIINLEWWNKALTMIGFNQDIFVGITPNMRTIRGEEIKIWLDKNTVNKYAIIDDDSDMLPEQKPSFFLSDGYVGLTPTIIYRIDRHFKK